MGKSDLQAKLKHKKSKKVKKGLALPEKSPVYGSPLDLQFFSIPNLLSPLHPSTSPLYKSPRPGSSFDPMHVAKAPLYPPYISPRPHGLFSPSPKKDSSIEPNKQGSSDFEFKSPAHPWSSPSSTMMDSPKKQSKLKVTSNKENYSTPEDSPKDVNSSSPRDTIQSVKNSESNSSEQLLNCVSLSSKVSDEPFVRYSPSNESSTRKETVQESPAMDDDNILLHESFTSSKALQNNLSSYELHVPCNGSSLRSQPQTINTSSNEEKHAHEINYSTSKNIDEPSKESLPECDTTDDPLDISYTDGDLIYDQNSSDGMTQCEASPKNVDSSCTSIKSKLNKSQELNMSPVVNKSQMSKSPLRSQVIRNDVATNLMNTVPNVPSTTTSPSRKTVDANKAPSTPIRSKKTAESNCLKKKSLKADVLPVPPQPSLTSIKLSSLSNQISMDLGQSIDFEVLPLPPPNLAEKVEELKSSILTPSDINNAEFGELMKSASSDESSQEFLQKIQESLRIHDKCDEVIFTVSNGTECANDLPTNSLDVTTSPSGVKVRLCSESDAIEKYDLLNESISPISKTPQKRGRGRRLDQQRQNAGSNSTLNSEDVSNFLANKDLISNFRYHLSIMMEGFTVPPEWEGIDPIIAMLASKKQNPHFAHIDIDSMMQLYAKILHYESYLSKSSTTPQKTPESEKQFDSVISPECSIKHEIIEDLDASPHSVILSSVHPPADRSVEYVPERYHASNGEKIGRGKHVITFDYDKSHFGPIFAESEEEVRAIVSLVQEKIAEIKSRKENRTLYSYSSSSVIAESLLPPDVLNYIRQSFTVKGLKKNIVGRKVRNYQRRSQVIKVDKVTGQLIYPTSRNKPSIKTEPEEEVSKTVSNELTISSLEKSVFSNDIPQVPQSKQSPETSSKTNKRDNLNDITELLGKFDSNDLDDPPVPRRRATPKLRNLRPLLAGVVSKPTKGKAPPRKNTRSKVAVEEALSASSLYVRPHKEGKVMKLLAQKEKKVKLLEKKKTKAQSNSGVYKGFSFESTEEEKKTDSKKEVLSSSSSKNVNKPEISKEEQDLMSELLQAAEEFDRCTQNTTPAPTTTTTNSRYLQNNSSNNNVQGIDGTDMPNLDDLF